MTPLTETAHRLIRSVLKPGGIAIDATVGNGFDTQCLAECVRPAGTVYGFDVQAAALDVTSQRLASVGLSHVVWLLRSHAEMSDCIPAVHHGRVNAMMWNLGYLPGGDKRLATQTNSTLASIRCGLSLLAKGGIITVLAYTGHPGGADEADAVEVLLRDANPAMFDFHEASPAPAKIRAPRLFVVMRRGPAQPTL